MAAERWDALQQLADVGGLKRQANGMPLLAAAVSERVISGGRLREFHGSGGVHASKRAMDFCRSGTLARQKVAAT